MDIEKILSEAPEKATHVDKNGHYFHNSTAFYWLCCDDGATCVADIGNGARKLSDLREIQRLRAENEALHKSIPKIKADAVREAVYELKKADGLNKSRLDTYDLLDYANNIESQAAKKGGG